MPEDVLHPATTELTFDRAVKESDPADAPSEPALACEACRAAIDTEYYFINGSTFCEQCRHAVESATAVPRGIGRFLKAAVFGGGAGLAGAAIYYGVIAITNFEIGLVAILIGYMVGYAVRKGGQGGGRRFQILAIALTYGAVALAYAPLAFKGALENAPAATSTTEAGATAAPNATAGAAPVSGGEFLFAFVAVIGIVAILPFLVVFSGISGLISALIIFIGMQQAWRMTGAPVLQIQGPYRVGAAPVSTPA